MGRHIAQIVRMFGVLLHAISLNVMALEDKIR
jgi:hypothetical protein